MVEVIGLVGREFERLVRWGYPGLLLVGLLQLGKPDLLHDRILVRDESVLSFIVIILVGSFLLYTIQRYVFHEIIYYVLYQFNAQQQEMNRGQVTLPGPRRRGRLPWYYWDANAGFANARFDAAPRTVFSDWLIYQFAIAHALGITGWLLAGMHFVSDEGSVLRDMHQLPLVLSGLFLAAWLWQLGHNFAGNRLLGPHITNDSGDVI